MDKIITTNIELRGDKLVAEKLRKTALLQLDIHRQYMSFQNLKQDVRRLYLTDGSLITIYRNHGHERVIIQGEPNPSVTDEFAPVEYIRYIAICLTAYDPGTTGIRFQDNWEKFMYTWHDPVLSYANADQDADFNTAYQIPAVWLVWDAKLGQVAEIQNATGTGLITFPCLFEDISHWFSWTVEPVLATQAVKEDWTLWDYWPAEDLPGGYPPISDVDLGSCEPAEDERGTGFYFPYGYDDVYFDAQRWTGTTADRIPFIDCVRQHFQWRYGITSGEYTDPDTGLTVEDYIQTQSYFLYTPLGYFMQCVSDYEEGKYYSCEQWNQHAVSRDWNFQYQWIQLGTDGYETKVTGNTFLETVIPNTCKHSSTVQYQIYGVFEMSGQHEIDPSGFEEPCVETEWTAAYEALTWNYHTEVYWRAACNYDATGESKGMYNTKDHNPFMQVRNTAFETALTSLSNGLWSLNGYSTNFPLIGLRLQIRHKPEIYLPS